MVYKYIICHVFVVIENSRGENMKISRGIRFIACLVMTLVFLIPNTACVSNTSSKPTGIDCTIQFDINGGIGSYDSINIKSGNLCL